MGQIKTSISVQDNVSAPFKAMNTAVNTTLNTFKNVNNELNSSSGMDYWTDAVGHYNKQALEAVYTTEELVQMGFKSADALKSQEQAAEQITPAIEENTKGQQKFNQEVVTGNNNAIALNGTISRVLKTFLGIQGIRKAFNFVQDATDAADVQIQAETKLNTITKQRMNATMEQTAALKRQASELQKVGVIGDEVTISGQATLSTFLNSTKSVENLTTAMDNLLAYTNGVESSAENAVSTANQIGKAMANNSLSTLTRSGITVTDEEEATFKALTSEEEKAALLAQIITNNVGEMNEALANTPAGQQQQVANAWGDMKEEIGTGLYPAVLNFFATINKNMPIIQQFANGFASGLYHVIDFLSMIIGLVCNVGQFISDNWSTIEPIIMGIVTALGLYYGAMLMVNLINGISAGIKAVHAAATAMETGTTFAATAAQYGFNAALLACPLTWIILLIIALIAVIIIVCNKIAQMGGTATTAFGVITGGINVVLQFFKNLGLTIANIALGIWNALCACATNVGVAFHNAIAGIQAWFYNLLSTVLNVVAKVCEALNKIPFVDIDYSGVVNKADEYAAKAAAANDSKEEYTSVSEAFNSGMSTFDTFQDGWASDAYNAGAAWGDGISNKVSSMFSKDSLDLNSITGGNALNNYEASDMADNIANTAANTGAIADSMDVTDEELKYLRDLAEQEVINRFTTAEIKVEMNNNNNINSEADLDGIVSGLEDRLYEMANSMAEGAHY